MKCSAAQKMTVLYRELDNDEKLRLDQHMASCEDCAQYHARYWNDVAMLKKTAAHVPFANEPDHALVERIMRAVQQAPAPRQSWGTLVYDLLHYRAMRYATVLASIVLISLFYIESNRTIENRASSQIPVSEATTILNHASLFERFRSGEKNDNKIEYNTTHASWMACLRTCRAERKQQVCESCLKKYIKTESYEGI